ncbi:MAG: NYN domain-containing protein [Halobacteriales archaeon]
MSPLRGLLGGSGDPEGVALLVDGPNCFREEFDVDLADLKRAGEGIGRLAVARVYLDDGAPSGLVRAVEAHGFEVVVTSGDVDVRLAVDAVDLACDAGLGTLAVVSRDADFKPALEAASRRGLRTVAIAPGEHGRSAGLANAADEALTL